MTTSLLLLSVSYALIAALLLALCISLPGRRFLKIVLIGSVSVFYVVTWLGHQSMLGWPTAEQMPDHFRVLWITIDEPDKAGDDEGGIFFWLRALDKAGLPQGTPRAYFTPFTEQAAEEAQAALGKIEGGELVNGSVSRNLLQKSDEKPDNENAYRGTDNVSGEDGGTPLFELRPVPPPTLPAKPAG